MPNGTVSIAPNSNRGDDPGAALARLRHVSTQGQDLEPQLRQLRAAGCTEVFEGKPPASVMPDQNWHACSTTSGPAT
jgi:hypothetical protein